MNPQNCNDDSAESFPYLFEKFISGKDPITGEDVEDRCIRTLTYLQLSQIVPYSSSTLQRIAKGQRMPLDKNSLEKIGNALLCDEEKKKRLEIAAMCEILRRTGY